MELYDLVRMVRRRDRAGLEANLTPKLAAMRDEDGWTLLFHALVDYEDKGGSLALVELLIARGVPVDAVDAKGWTALHLAARDHPPAFARALLRAGAPVDPTNNYGNSPLWIAASEHRTDVAEVLLDHGADPDKANDSGVTPRASATRSPLSDLRASFEGKRAPVVASAPYAATVTYVVGDRVRHPTFGEGRVHKVVGDKVDILFDEGRKILLHGRRPR